MSTFRMGVDLSGLKAKLKGYEEQAIEATRAGAQAGAQVFYDQVKANVGRIGKKTGNLDKAIYQKFSEDNSGPGVAVYHVGWNKRKAPHGFLVEYGHVQRYVVYIDKAGNWKTAKRKNAKGAKPGRKASQARKDAYYLPLEGGPRHVAARPFLRPAKDRAQEAKQAAIERFKRELLKRGVTT